MKKFAILGLGVFGQSIAQALTEKGAEVIAVDRDMLRVEEIQDYVSVAVRLDSTDENALKAQAIHEVDVAIVCIGENFESNLLTAVLLKQLGVPEVITRATRAIEEKILVSVGIDRVVLPEQEMGEKLAYNLMHPKLHEIVHLSGDLSIAELSAPAAFIGKTLAQLHLRRKFGVNLITIRRTTENGSAEKERQKTDVIMPDADTAIAENDLLVLFGKKADLDKLLKKTT